MPGSLNMLTEVFVCSYSWELLQLYVNM